MYKQEFIKAFCYLYGSTKKAAAAAYNNSSTEYKKAIIEAYKKDCKLSFYND